MNILEQIVAQKREEVILRQSSVNARTLEAAPLFSRKCISLRSSLVDASKNGIIAEFKRKSPSKGSINSKASVEEVTLAYTQFGASGISVLTDEKYFGGGASDLTKARQNNIPILRKDFIVDRYQLIEAKAMGADVILLIAACLSPVEVRNMSAAAKALGLETLLEIHDASELDHICDDVDIVGVNNRSLKTFQVDIQTSIALIKKIPPGKPVISESGISGIDTILRLKHAGFNGFLIGEYFMKQPDPAAAFVDFSNQLKAAL
jgi:indole-3-glycerol phosphate synthase